ncbi:hypothetical protein DCS32_04210 [Dokdonia sp. Dokd-P16]|uniref:hypothetical protein n=1 Tax=Dokdonia sp. Dokd-P16 TaxID=2173169 RepID=UPI000D544805|nr:hypothetical protein [Dokdonia sp. Dokd-P16]AWH73391.1 hypothetical protein DCS32_04210 [Dokdonia sp. Dokd-P16]
MKKVILSIAFCGLFVGSAFPMNQATEIESEVERRSGYECLILANSVATYFEFAGFPDEVAFDIATTAFEKCME